MPEVLFMKKCIWCSKSSPAVTFDKIAHTYPQSLGGKRTCENVCDLCNKFFGDKERFLPSVEIALKEVLNISRHIILTQNGKKSQKRFTSEYFVFNANSNVIKHKMKYKLTAGFQEEFARRFRRGIYKIYLEERERQKGDALDSRFDFIRAFARYDFNDCLIYYLKPKFKILGISDETTSDPQIHFTKYSDNIDKIYRFYSYSFFGHNLVLPTHNVFHEEFLELYKGYLRRNDALGKDLIEVKSIFDIDFAFEYLSDHR